MKAYTTVYWFATGRRYVEKATTLEDARMDIRLGHWWIKIWCKD